jgi:predicted enzyme related to lactoylglutathione lyase
LIEQDADDVRVRPGPSIERAEPRDVQDELAQQARVMGALQKRRELLPGQPTIGSECTIAVPSIDATAKAVLASGGKTVLEKSIIVAVGALMFFQDTEGNVFGAIQFDPHAE